jgi:alkylation response protein AidB-like acyl-CoA dehydrogenase
VRDFLGTSHRWYRLVPGEEPASDFTFQFCRKLGEQGLLAPHWPSEYGGRDASGWQFIILGEELWRAGEPRGAQYMNVNWIGPAIMGAGTPDQKRYHLRRITSGDVIWCQGFSEPEAGTDLASLTRRRPGRATVRPRGDPDLTSYAVGALLLRAGAHRPEQRDSRGISIFLVPTDTRAHDRPIDVSACVVHR